MVLFLLLTVVYLSFKKNCVCYNWVTYTGFSHTTTQCRRDYICRFIRFVGGGGVICELIVVVAFVFVVAASKRTFARVSVSVAFVSA